MKTGIELIAEERKRQIEKLDLSVAQDARVNSDGQLYLAASALAYRDIEVFDMRNETFEGWNLERWQKMHDKPHRERLIIAGALIAAELDRLNHVNDLKLGR